MEDKRIEILRDMPVGKAINKLSLPAIIGMVVMGLYNVADTIFVSRWNYQGAAAVQVLFPIMMLASAIGLTFGVGSGSYISRLLGKDDKEKANQVLSTALFTALFIAVLYIALALIHLRVTVALFGAEGEIVPLAIDYGFFIIIGSLFVIPSMVLNNTLRAEGSAKYSMIGMVVGTVLNIGLDPIFIFTLGLGLKGAALATMLSQGVCFLILLFFYLSKKSFLNLSFKSFKFERIIYREIFKIGLPTFFRQVLFSLSLAILNQSATRVGGDFLLSAMGIALKVVGVPIFFIFGLGQGVQPVVGYNFGAMNKKRMLDAQKYGIKVAFIGSFICTLVLFTFAKYIMMIFTSQAEVLRFGLLCIRLMSLGLLFTSVSNTISIVYQAIGNGKLAFLFSILRQGILLIPAILILSNMYQELGVIIAQPLADFLTLVISLIVYIPFVKRQKEDLV